MSLLRNLAEKRSSPNDPSYPLSGMNLSKWADWFGGGPTKAGTSISETTAPTIAAVYRSVQVLSGSVAQLPLKTYRNNTREELTTQLLDKPHPDLTRFEFWELAMTYLLLWGNFYAERVKNGLGTTGELWPIPASAVTPRRDKPSKANPSGKVFEVEANNTQYEWTSEKVFHIPGLGFDGLAGKGVVSLARESLGLTKATEEFGAAFFGKGSLMSGILTTDKPGTEDWAAATKARWQKALGGLDHAHEIAVLDNGLKFLPVSIPPDDAQFLETREHQVTEIARWFGLPPHMLFQTEKQTSWGTGIEQQTIGFIQYTLQPTWLRRIESRVTKDLTPNDRYAEFNVEGLLRGDSKARAEFYRAMVEMRAMSPNEVRAKENMQPYDGGDVYENPNTTSPDAGDAPPDE